MKKYNEFIKDKEVVNENINEASNINIDSDQFALAIVGGSIGNGNNIIIKNQWGTIIETSNDEQYIKDLKKTKSKNLSATDKSFYNMKYIVFKITPAIIKQVKSWEDLKKIAANVEEIN